MAAAALQRAATQGDRSEGAVRARLEVEVAVAGDNESRDGSYPPALDHETALRIQLDAVAPKIGPG